MEFILSDVRPVAMELRIIFQLAPRDCVRVSADCKPRAERRDRIDNLATDLLDLEVPDRSDAAAIGVIHRRALDPIAANEGMTRGSRTLSLCHLRPPLSAQPQQQRNPFRPSAP